ncbi:MAG TPA: integrase core domain-containing protein, partial [Burkholderiales bacterium]|nr:integrase core domain-containing protein [Burkholderiales bacterium]
WAHYLLFDRDSIFSEEVVATVLSMAIDPKRTSFRSPWQNDVAERFVGSVRRELLDHVIVLDDCHLRRLLTGYTEYYLQDRTHLGIAKDSPHARPVEPCPAHLARVCARPRVGGLHHRYSWQAEA